MSSGVPASAGVAIMGRWLIAGDPIAFRGWMPVFSKGRAPAAGFSVETCGLVAW